jgi:hypothetical protein
MSEVAEMTRAADANSAVVHEHEMKVLEDRWEAMVGRLGSESFPDFLRVHWNSRSPFLRQTELSKTIRGKIATCDAVFNLIRQMEEDIDAYMGLTEPQSSPWSPENVDVGWNAFSDDEAEAMGCRFGNLTLLSKGANKDLGNQPYSAKRVVYAQSTFGITRKVAEDHADWTPDRIAAHQRWMANQATAIWRIDQLS